MGLSFAPTASTQPCGEHRPGLGRYRLCPTAHSELKSSHDQIFTTRGAPVLQDEASDQKAKLGFAATNTTAALHPLQRAEGAGNQAPTTAQHQHTAPLPNYTLTPSKGSTGPPLALPGHGRCGGRVLALTGLGEGGKDGREREGDEAFRSPLDRSPEPFSRASHLFKRCSKPQTHEATRFIFVISS